MNCKFHNEISGTSTCSVCGAWICETCTLEVDGRVYCRNCLKEKAKLEENTNNQTFDSPMNKSGLLTLLFSLIPGCGHMYLGFMKKGMLLVIISFIAMMITTDNFPIIIPIFLYSIFDAFSIKGKIEKGINKEDNFEDEKRFIKQNNKLFVILGSILIISAIIGVIGESDIVENMVDCVEHRGEDILDFIEDNILEILIVIGIIMFFCFKKFNNKNRNDTPSDIGKNTNVGNNNQNQRNINNNEKKDD